MTRESKKDDRLFAPFPIEMDEHPKIIGLSDAAFRAVFEATFYSRRMLSDGFLDERVVLKRWGLPVAEELSCNDPEKPSWIRVDTPKPGWRIHDFEKHHPLKAEIDAGREAKREAGRLGGKRSGEARRSKAEAEAKQDDSADERNRTPESETESQTETSPSNEGESARKRASTVADDFSINERMRDWAAENVPLVDIDRVLPEFIDYWQGVGKPMKDWEAVWRNGMRKQQGFAERDSRGRPTRDDENMAVVARLAAREAQQKGIEG